MSQFYSPIYYAEKDKVLFGAAALQHRINLWGGIDQFANDLLAYGFQQGFAMACQQFVYMWQQPVQQIVYNSYYTPTIYYTPVYCVYPTNQGYVQF